MKTVSNLKNRKLEWGRDLKIVVNTYLNTRINNSEYQNKNRK